MKKAKRILALITSLTIVASNISPAFAGKFESEYNDINKDKKYPQIDNRIINTLDNDEIYNLKEGESISDPEQPDVYTYRWSYKRPVTGRSVNIKEMELASQPYVASVGEKASEEEKAKVNYKLKPPILKGYKKPEEDYQASYDFIKDNASEKEDFLHNGTRDINYEPTTNSGIKVKHLFQKLEDRNAYENLDGGADIITKQKNFFGEFPKTGQKLKLDNLFSRNVENPIGYSDREFLDLKEKIKGFEPERNADNLEIIVPEVANTPFVIHYNRKSFQVKINTDGGTYIPDMTLFYGQTIPPVTQTPKKDGAVFDHWEADKDICIKDKSGETTTIKAKTPIDMKKYQDGFRHAMPAEDITFKAIYKENETAEYSVEFWVEKADYDDKKPNLSIKDKYEFVGNRVLTGKTGSVPDIASTSKDGIAFPDLDKARLNKIYKDSTEFDKYFKYNKELTDSQNQDVSNEKVEDDSGESVYKKVSRTIDAAGNTSYKIYFDRQVYTLYFSKLITNSDSENLFWPIITKDGKVYDSKKGEPYSFKARFNQNLQSLWPDPIENVKGYPEDYRSLGWVASTKNKEYSYRDTPPYRLTADDFLDSSDIKDKKKGGYSKTLPLGDNGEKQLGEREMCFGIDSSNLSKPYQVEFIMDTYPGFEVEGETVEKIRDYSLHYRKFDTPLETYDFTPPDIEGFEPKHEKTRIIDEKDKDDWEELNEEDSDRLEEFKTYLKFIGAPREDVKNYKDLYNEKYRIRFLRRFPVKDENDQEEENQDENKEENNQEGNQEDKNKEENNQEKENVQPIEFEKNYNLEFEYSRKSYTINFNNDPRKVRDDTSYKDSEKESVPYQHPLRWLDGVYNFDYEKSDEENKEAREKYDQEHIIDNRVPEKPAWVPESWKFLGWSLNPEGTSLVRDGNYTMPARNITLYAKWGCDTKRKVTFDLGLDAGETTKYMIKANDLKSIKYDVGDDVRTSIKENKKYKLPTEDKTSTSGKQVFLVDNGLSIKSPAIPRRVGYDFMGWEHVVYKKDSKGDDTSEVDDSFKQKYHLPRQYTFESEVYSDVYLKAIWAKNNLYDVKIKDHILDDKLNEVKTETNILENQREGTFAFYFARLQGEKLTLVADKELDQAPEYVKNTFTQYRAKLKEKSAIADNRNTDASDGVNTYYQNVKVDPTTSPNAYNELQFFYKPYRKREYKVNYLLVDNNADLNDTTKYPSVGKPNSSLTKPIMDQDDVLNGNRHYDARNFRSIPGFKLVSKPQVQLVFEVNEESNKLLKINGVDVGDNLENAQVNFYYKDIRVIKNNGDNPPKGYHRITFKAKDNGSFGKDEDGKPIKEVHYDVIDGLYFAKAHVPTNEGKKDKNDADLIADPGYQIGNWSQEGNPTSGLLDPYTVISKDYTFEINFIERKYPEISPIKVFESAKEDNSYINNFMLTKDDYDKALEGFKQMDDYKSYQILDDDKDLYEKLKEDPLYRDQPSDPEPIKTSIRVKINFKDKSSKEFTIPVLVYKNIYRALDSKSKPNIVNKDDFLKDFVKVTVDPTDKAADKQTKTYYVNPKAKLLIPEKDPTPEDAKKYTFEKWSDGKVDYNFKNRFKFQKDTEIQAIYKEDKKDVIAYDPKEPITRPEGYVRVTFKADEGLSLAEEKAYYIRKEAKINLGNKAIEKPPVNNAIGYKFDKWDTDDTTVIGNQDIVVTAEATPLKDTIEKKVGVDQPKGYVEVKFVAGKNGRVEEKTYYVNPTKYVKLSPPSTQADTGYVFAGWDKNAKEFNIYDTDTTIKANFNPIDSVIAKTKDDDSEKPAGFVEVKFAIDGEGGKIVDGQAKTYYVKPNTEVTIPQPQTKADIGYEFEKWEPDTTTKRKYTDKVTTIKGTFKALPASIPAKDKDEKDKPNGYIRIVFRADKNGWLADEQNNFIDQKVYYVNPKAKIDYIKDLTQGIEKVANPAYTADGGSWKDETGLLSKLFTKDKLFVYHFKEAQNIIADGNGQPIPDGFVKVSFKADENGKLEGDKKEITYYVNPQAGIKLVKGVAGEKELQVPKTVANADYTFTKWVEDLDLKNPITGDRKYVAKFAKDQVSLSYEIGKDAQGTAPEKVTRAKGTKVRLASDKGISKKDHTFKGWKIGEKIYQAGDEITLKEITTATAQWEKDADVIPYDPENPIAKPQGYVRVSFEADDGLTLTNVKNYYVKKNAGIKIGDKTIVKPTANAKTGYEFETWSPKDQEEIKNDDIVVKAKSNPYKDTIEKIDKNTKKPDGYVEVKFVAGKNGQLEKDGKKIEEKIYYVNPNKYVKLIPPATKGDTGYEFGAWDKLVTGYDIYKEPSTTITANFNEIKAVIPKTDDSEKQEGYVEVNFEIEGDGGKIVDGQVTSYYVDPTREVTINPPATQAGIGYVFEKWNPDTISKAKKYNDNTTVKGNFKKLDNLIPSTNDKGQPNPKPQGYVTVTFKADTNGSLKGETKYYVNPTKEVDLTADANKIEKIANTGYTSDGGSWKDGNTEATLKSTFTKDTEFVYNFKGLADVIPKTRNDDKEKPQGYIEVSFDTTDKGTIENSQETTKVVYVNPEKAVVLEGYAPKVSPKTGYTFANWDTSINKPIQYKDKDKIKATYTDLENISTTKKAGFVKAIFKEGEHGSLEGTSEYWIKPNTEVKIPAPRVKTNIGYSFEKWDKNLKVKLNDDSADYEITAEYKKLDDIIPDDGKTEKPADYITITFQADSNGSLRGITRYFVNPDKEVDLTQKANHIEKIAKVGYTSDEGKWKDGDEEATLNASFSKDKTFIYNFTPYKDIIPAEKIAKKPSGYVKVTFKADENGKLAGDKEEITYYVNPQAGIKLKVLGENEQVADKELAVPDTKPDENYKFIKWFEAIDKNTPITGNREYVAIFGKTEVSLSYDLNGGSGTKPETKTVPYGTSLRLATDEGISKKDAKFIGWSIDGQIYKPGAEITLTKDQKAIAKWTDDENIISYNPKDPITRPSGYVRVTFKADKGLSLTEEKAYYVKADKGISLKEIKDNKGFGYPAYTEETGYSFDKWDKDDSTVINKDIELTAKATKAKDVVPKTKDDDSEKTDGYVKVTFVAGVNGKLGNETNTFFVNPTKYVKLTPPSTKADTGYTFAGWDKNATEFNIYDTDTTITAGFNPIDSAIPKTKDDESEKPSGYVTVNFVIDPATGGKIVEKEITTYYVKPNTEVTIPQPQTKAEIGYEFDKWDKNTSEKVAYSTDTKVKGSFKELDKYIPSKDGDKENKKPEGYIEVVFQADENGRLEGGDKTFYVNPDVKIDENLVNELAKAIVKKPNEGYTADGGNWEDKSGIFSILTKNKLFVYHFKEAKNVIPDGNGEPIPSGFIKVTLRPTDKAKDSTEKSYWVNPKVEVEIPYDNPEGKTVEDKAHKGYTTSYTFKEWKVTKGKVATYTGKVKGQFKEETVLEATYTEKTSGKGYDLTPAVKVKKDIITPQGKTPKAEELIVNTPGQGKDPLPDKTKISYEKNGEPDTSKPGSPTAKVKIEYPNGKTVVIEVPIKVVNHIVPQEGDDKPEVPSNYVKVVIDTTNKATENTYFVKTYWVNPEAEVSFPVKAPSGKSEEIDGVTSQYEFSSWKLEASDKDYGSQIKDKFSAKESKIVATYKTDKNIEPEGNDGLLIPEDENPDPRDFIKNDYDDKNPDKKDKLPPGTKFTFKEGKDPKTDSPHEGKTTIVVEYPNGEKKEIEVGYKVVGKVVPQEGEEKPEVPNDYVKVSLIPTDKSEDQEKIYWVRPRVEVTIPDYKVKGKDKWIFKDWDKKLTDVFMRDTEIRAIYAMETIKTSGDIIVTEKGKQPEDGEYRKRIQIQEEGEETRDLTDKDEIKYEKPDVSTLGDHPVKVKVKLEDGTELETTIIVRVVDTIYELDKDHPEKNENIPDNYIQVIVVPTTDNEDSEEHYYAVKKSENDEDIRKIDLPKIKAVEGKTFLGWEVRKGTSKYESYDKEGEAFSEPVNIIRAKFVDDVLIQTGKEKPQVPDNYVKVVVDRTDYARKPRKTIYWVNPAKEVDLGEVDPSAKDGYSFKGWKLSEKKKEEDNDFKDISSKFDLEGKKHKYQAYESHIEAVFEKIKTPSPTPGPGQTPGPSQDGGSPQDGKGKNPQGDGKKDPDDKTQNPDGGKPKDGQAGKGDQKGDTDKKEPNGKSGTPSENTNPPSSGSNDGKVKGGDGQNTSQASGSDERDTKIVTRRQPQTTSNGSNKRVFSKVKTGIRSNFGVYLTIITISAIGYVLCKKK